VRRDNVVNLHYRPSLLGTSRRSISPTRFGGIVGEQKLEFAIMLFLVVSTPRPERPSELAQTRQSFWPWIARYEARGVCRHVYARVGRGAVAVFDVEDNNALHQILNEWADVVPAHFDTYPLIDVEAAKQMLAAQAAAKRQ
jgi:muconolactone delta-isomerase